MSFFGAYFLQIGFGAVPVSGNTCVDGSNSSHPCPLLNQVVRLESLTNYLLNTHKVIDDLLAIARRTLCLSRFPLF